MKNNMAVKDSRQFKREQKILRAYSQAFSVPLMTLYQISNALFLIFGVLAMISFHICLIYGYNEYKLTEKRSIFTILRHASYHPMFLITLILSFTSISFLVAKFETYYYYYRTYHLVLEK